MTQRAVLSNALFALAVMSFAGHAPGMGPDLVQLALSDNSVIAAKGIERLRIMGPSGLGDLLHRIDTESVWKEPANAERARLVVEAVAAQRGAMASRLFWHTDLNRAIEMARDEQKPILSLRLLGKLDEELSCANSRFFRVALYANKEVSTYLRDHFVLHWESVRPVPVITIDMGDGRTIRRSITGNSIHYVLDSRGRVIDAIPGLVGPVAFLDILKQAEALSLETTSEEDPAPLIRSYHELQGRRNREQWLGDLKRLGMRLDDAHPSSFSIEELVKLTEKDDANWSRLASLHRERLDAASRIVFASMTPNAFEAGRIAVSKAVVEDPMLRLVGRFERSLAEDSVRNRYALRGTLHDWFRNGNVPFDLKPFNERVYGELFMMPLSDPWLGLRNAFDAIEETAQR